MSWSCERCTFRHKGELAQLLSCSMCGAGRGSSPSAGGGSRKRDREPDVVVLSSDDDDNGEQSSRTPRIVIDLASPRREAAAGRVAAGSAPQVAIDVDADDATIATLLTQAQADVVVLDDEALAPAASGGAIDFKALNEARQRRIARQQRLGGSSGTGEQQADLLYDQRRGLEARCTASAQHLRLRVTSLEHNEASRPGQPS